MVESKNIFEVHNAGTQTDGLAFHGLQEDFERTDDDHIIGQGDVVDEKIIAQEETVEPSVSSDTQIIVQEEIMESEMEAFVEGLLQKWMLFAHSAKALAEIISTMTAPCASALASSRMTAMMIIEAPKSRRQFMPSETGSLSATG